jgi:signal transduction histidine kinase/CheY-like chemotaxis protein
MNHSNWAETDLLRAVMEAVPVGVVVTDAAGRLQLVNPSAEAILGGVRGHAFGPVPGDTLLRADSTPCPPNELPLAVVIETGTAVEDAELILKRADGREVSLLVSARPIRSGEGAITGAIATLVDVTARRRAETQRRRTMDEFLAMVSHELRTPLNAITGWAHMLKQGTLDRELVDKAVDIIIRNAGTQGRLVNDLLDMSRILSGHLRLDVQELQLIPVIEEVIETLRPVSAAKRVEIVPVLDPKAEPILGDATRMQQVVWNLLSNAIKFTPAGGRVTVSLERAGSHVRIVVADYGAGIRPAFLPHVFDRFRQGDAADALPPHAGLGLGLAIVRHLVELHGGTVDAHSDGEGTGATFTVTLPWWNPRVIESAADDAHEGGAGLDLKGLRVLLVEDEGDTRELISYMLGRFQATVRAVSSGTEALADIREFRPDVLVSDLHMPAGDGYELIRAVRSLPPEEGGRIPAIALTGLARAEDRRSALDAGYQVHVPKPVTPAKLTAVLGFVTRQREAKPILP